MNNSKTKPIEEDTSEELTHFPLLEDPDESETGQRLALKRMRRLAGGLLLIMTLIFLTATFLLSHWEIKGHHFLSYLRAFAEAAMVGGIADWFAVTALFRHPLGLPIPHTAIIPTKQASIGDSLGKFVENKFLTPEILEKKLGNLEVTKKLEEWLAVPSNTALIAENIAQIIPALLNSLDDDDVRRFIEVNIFEKVQGNEVASVAGNLLTILTSNKKHDQLFNELIKIADKLLEENKDSIRKKIKEESPWFIPKFVNETVSKKIIDNVDKTIDAATQDPNHPLRKRFHTIVEQFINDLRTSPEFHSKIDEIKEELIQNPTVQNYLNQVWADLKAYILENIANPESEMRLKIHESIYRFCEDLIKDETLRQKISNWVYNTILNLANKYRHEIGRIISDTMKGWEPDRMTRELELYVGKDLQYIRISGTLVGGTVGFLIHLLTHLVEMLINP